MKVTPCLITELVWLNVTVAVGSSYLTVAFLNISNAVNPVTSVFAASTPNATLVVQSAVPPVSALPPNGFPS